MDLSPNAQLINQLRSLTDDQIKEAENEILYNTPVRSDWEVVKSKNKKRKERSVGSVILNTDNKRTANDPTKNTNPIQFIIDGVGKNFNNIEIIANEIKRCKPNLEILEIKKLKKGGIRVTVPDTHNLNIAVQEWPIDSLGGNSFTTLINDMRDTICINKYSVEKEANEVRKYLSENDIKYDSFRRKVNTRGQPTTLICFKTNKENTEKLKKEGMLINNEVFTVRSYINKENIVSRCTKCQKFGHHYKNCNQKNYTCVRCGGNSCGKICEKDTRSCANCKGNHSAAYKGCTVYKAHQKKAEQDQLLKISTKNLKNTETDLKNSYADIVKKTEVGMKIEKEKMENLYKKLQKAEQFMCECQDITEKLEEEEKNKNIKIMEMEKKIDILEKKIISHIDIAVILTDCIARCFGGKEDKNTEILSNVAHVVGNYFKININQNQIIAGIKNNIPSKLDSNKQKRLISKQS